MLPLKKGQGRSVSTGITKTQARRNVELYPWFKFSQSLLFWQSIWFLYFQNQLSAAEAILLYVVYDIATTVMEVPSGYMSDRWGRRKTLIAVGVASGLGALILGVGAGFWIFALGQIAIGAGSAFSSGTDTAFLYESLVCADQDAELEAQELRAWRFGFAGFGLSAPIGGAAAMVSETAPFLMTAASAFVAVVLAWRFVEPRRAEAYAPQGGEWMRVRRLGQNFRHPVLLWLFGLSVLVYGFSHVAFVFGQPFILKTLETMGAASETPFVSGTVTAAMMGVSILASLAAPGLRKALGLPVLLLFAFALQVLLTAVLALSASAVAIVFLLLRMVTSALTTPFIHARIQPLLSDESRATYLSLQGLCARLFFAITLFFAAGAASTRGQMPMTEVQSVLAGYAIGGVLCLLVLALFATRIEIEN